MNVQGTYKESYDELKNPGDFMFSEGCTTLIWICPCGCGDRRCIGVAAEQSPKVWKWNGSKERPTTEPSILGLDGCKWHGYLVDGEWRQC